MPCSAFAVLDWKWLNSCGNCCYFSLWSLLLFCTLISSLHLHHYSVLFFCFSVCVLDFSSLPSTHSTATPLFHFLFLSFLSLHHSACSVASGILLLQISCWLWDWHLGFSFFSSSPHWHCQLYFTSPFPHLDVHLSAFFPLQRNT